MSKHTPGPWERFATLNRNTFTIFGGDELVAQVIPFGDSVEQAEANLRMIAAAPDLFKALENLMLAIEHGGSKWNKSAWREARAAIAKAEGRAE